MRLDEHLSVNKEWFEKKTKSEQVEWIKRSRHILTTADANKLLKNVSSKPEPKKKKK